MYLDRAMNEEPNKRWQVMMPQTYRDYAQMQADKKNHGNLSAYVRDLILADARKVRAIERKKGNK